MLTELPSIDKRTFKSMTSDEQKDYMFAQQLVENEPGRKVNGRYLAQDQDLIATMKPTAKTKLRLK
jgi:hypothetical protein